MNFKSGCAGARKVGPVTRGSRRQLHGDGSPLRPVSTRVQLQIRLRPSLPQLPPRAVRGGAILLCRSTSRGTSLHPDLPRGPSLRQTPCFHLRPRELARSHACCCGNPVCSFLHIYRYILFTESWNKSGVLWDSGSRTTQTTGSQRLGWPGTWFVTLTLTQAAIFCFLLRLTP